MTVLDMIGGFAASAVVIVLLAVVDRLYHRRHGDPDGRETGAGSRQ